MWRNGQRGLQHCPPSTAPLLRAPRTVLPEPPFQPGSSPRYPTSSSDPSLPGDGLALFFLRLWDCCVWSLNMPSTSGFLSPDLPYFLPLSLPLCKASPPSWAPPCLWIMDRDDFRAHRLDHVLSELYRTSPTILVCPGLRAFMERGAFSATTGGVQANWGDQLLYL